MKKLFLPIMLLLAAVFFLSPKADAQTSTDCYKVFTEESNACLKESTKCISSCVEKGSAAMSLTVDGAKVSLECQRNVCDPANKACDDKAMANFKACGKTDKQPEAAEAKKETPKQEEKSVVQTIDDWIRENHLEYNPDNIVPKPSQLKEEMFQKARLQWRSEMVKSQIEPTFEFVWEGQWPDVKAVVFDNESGAVIKSDSWQNIYLQELADQITKSVILQQGEMEVRVVNEKPTENKVNVEVGDFFDIFVIQTHFRVEYDPEKKLGVVNVYEGEVEVRTNDGKVAKIKPDGDKPGIVVVSRRLSPIKLTVVGVILIAIIGGAILVLKRKFTAGHIH